jgi:hypothetical protein
MDRPVDPARLFRALQLAVTPEGPDGYRVSGGCSPHRVTVQTAGLWACDCADQLHHPGEWCKHLLAVYLDRQLAAPVRQALRQLLSGKTAA